LCEAASALLSLTIAADPVESAGQSAADCRTSDNMLLLLLSQTTAKMHFPAKGRVLDFFCLEDRYNIPVTGFSMPGRSDVPKLSSLVIEL